MRAAEQFMLCITHYWLYDTERLWLSCCMIRSFLYMLRFGYLMTNQVLSMYDRALRSFPLKGHFKEM